MPVREFTPGADPPGSNPGRDAAERRAEAVAAAVFAWIILAEAVGPLQAMGGALILAGIFAARPRRARS